MARTTSTCTCSIPTAISSTAVDRQRRPNRSTSPSPVAGEWTLVVHGWQTDGPDALYDLFTWIVGDADAGNLTVSAPASAIIGETGTVTLTWADLTPAMRYLGSVSYSDGTNDIGQTLVAIKT